MATVYPPVIDPADRRANSRVAVRSTGLRPPFPLRGCAVIVQVLLVLDFVGAVPMGVNIFAISGLVIEFG